MTHTITVTVPGEPIPQGSKRAYNGNIVDDNAARLKPWRATLTDAIAAGIPDNWDRTGPFQVIATFVFPRPQSHYHRDGRQRGTAPLHKHNRPGDIDKLVRAVLDACTDAHAWKDDSQAAHLDAVKVYGEKPLLQLILRRIDTQEGHALNEDQEEEEDTLGDAPEWTL